MCNHDEPLEEEEEQLQVQQHMPRIESLIRAAGPGVLCLIADYCSYNYRLTRVHGTDEWNISIQDDAEKTVYSSIVIKDNSN